MTTRHLYLDTSPPAYTGSRTELDKSAFHKTLPVLAVRVRPEKVGKFLKGDAMKRALLDIPKVRTVVSDPKEEGNRLVLLRMPNEGDIPPEALELIKTESNGLTEFNVNLDYNYWTADEILQSFLPEELREGAPSGFAMVGHIAHLNLNEEYLPYKYIIGQLILEKNNRVRTVVNKINSIDTQFRFFKMELLAGEPDYVVEHHESDCRFMFDFTKVYWNSRLHTEHDRLIQVFQPEEVVADVFAGVGPFAIPAGKKGCGVLANDLNPESYKYLAINAKNNRVDDTVKAFCEDGREFIQKSVSRLWEEPLPAYTGPKQSRVQEEKERRRLQRLKAEGQTVPIPPSEKQHGRRRISHFVMNLPDSAISFLDAFRGLLSGAEPALREQYSTMPMVHCHCFTREVDSRVNAEGDIRKRVEEKLGGALTSETSFHFVRSVAPNKDMYCISFRLPPEVAFGERM
ncbi:tRNA (guanine-N(1)-)-methyltransferase [Coprinopsis cinerea okayama7|uniref:tRNA (guanine(37)-N(1))-methyltransferase n=1 Tax=Coprinopsis cinerea (strain Okayama-7 / 130 / ATCC MYA-4618 / FGSC 9003) TaxID=240176 RepID=TRM5_COPC7|nr:tRNA (guanine-N(1)-)-methyltransferase [Coprinopsis cinerea okayama7\|eukprot:XP_001829211.2 tRNA (guanine-N(1)-)-methyltransferase [Coprinopsis cinerea okayama7\